MKRMASRVDFAVNSEMESPPTRTASASGFNRWPWQSGQTFSAMRVWIFCLMMSESVRWNWASSMGMTPSKPGPSTEPYSAARGLRESGSPQRKTSRSFFGMFLKGSRTFAL